MRAYLFIAFSLILFSASAQRMSVPDRGKCNSLKTEEDRGATVDGDTRSICQIAQDHPTPYNRCRCSLAKEIEAYESNLDNLIDQIVAKYNDLQSTTQKKNDSWAKYLGLKNGLDQSDNFEIDKGAAISQLEDVLQYARQLPGIFNQLESLRSRLPVHRAEFQKPYRSLADYQNEITRLEADLQALRDYSGPVSISINESSSLSISSSESSSNSSSGSNGSSSSNSGNSNKTNSSSSSSSSSSNSSSSSSSSSSDGKSAAQLRRETKAAMDAQRQKEFNQSMDAAAEAGGALLGAGLMGLMEMESFEYLRIGYGLRQQDQIKFPSEEDEYPVSFNTLEVGVGFGHFGIFVGGGLSPSYLASPVTNPSGYTAFGGLEYVILYNDNGYDLSLCAEGGYGSLSIEKTHNFPDVFYENYKSTFYGVGVGVTLFQYLHLSYTYGMHTGERTRDTGSEILPVDEIEGYYSRVGIGIKFGLWYM